ncbi:hypothetical protein H2202_008879 [Exophiala xenobiotica]|nr:hypothetical protein H2202_008879 [Exophiala xenobiotica]KAK5224476.1 hypothetical protein LTR72_004257 [Exophiala xenobiotica]KAK5229023.1 hypothetical protein LTR47_008181 [Exophiala xenobiotica]KAK5244760.1 hypothetical protein LTS06_009725 [Exophiala xenobiotica]KAK5288868.1 hypothetical protein LTR14_007698 [Exophiala xenobiotica]
MAGQAKPAALRRSVRSQNKSQTRLQFTPLPSSSPTNANYSQAVQDRLASVRYHGAKESTIRRHGDVERPIRTLPTPEPSSQPEVTRDGFPREPTYVSLPSSPTPIRSVDTQRVDSSDEDDLITSTKKRRRLSPSVETPTLPSGRSSTRLQPGASSPSHNLTKDMPSSPPTRRSGRLTRKPPPPSARSQRSRSSQSDVSAEIPTPTRRQSSGLSNLGSAETSDDDDPVMVSKPTSRRRISRADAKDPSVVNDDEIQYQSEEEVLSSHKRKTPWKRGDDFVVEDDDVEYISSEEEHHIANRSAKSRRLSSKQKSPHRRSREQLAELEEDLHDLQDSDDQDLAINTRTRGGPVTTERDKTRAHFEALRRRRAGEKVARVVDSEEEEEEAEPEGVDIDLIGQPAHDISDQDSVHSSIDTDQESVQEQVEDEDDFVEEDSTGRLGRPHPDIPLQFTSFASAKPRELFPHIIEWLVKNKIAPAFSRDDELYRLAFSRIDDQVKAQAGSRLISSAWGADFKRTILARPTMKVVALPGEDEDNIRTCDACNRTNHPARYEFLFSGEPYYQKTLEPVDDWDDDDDVEADRDDDATYDELGHLLPPENRRFYLGRFCAANAEMGHKLTHWKHHLNESLMAYLEEQGVLSAEAIIARDKMNHKKREKQAENVVDEMQETGVIAELWANFENDLNDARLGMEDYEKKGGRSKGRIGAIRSTANGLVREWSGGKYRVTRALESESEGE